MLDDKGLVKKLLAHDHKTARETYTYFMPRLLHFIRKKINNEQDVEEIAQDTLFAFLEGLRDFTFKSSISTYIYAIANHKIIDFYRKKKLKKIVFSQLPPNWEQFLVHLKDPQKIYDDKVVQQQIKGIFSKLTPVYCQLLRLKYLEDKSVSEIAKILKMSFKSAESMLFRARKSFVKLYGVK